MSSASASGWSSKLLALTFVVALVPAAPGTAKVFHSQRDGLALAFPDADRIERRNLILTEAQGKAVEKRSRAPLDSRIISVHIGYRGDEVLGYAWIEVHRVRTLPEALMTVLTPDGTVHSVRVLAFHEPLDYLPPARWLAQFDQKRLSPDLQLKRDIDAISGATLSSRAATRSVRRALAVYEVMISTPTATATGD